MATLRAFLRDHGRLAMLLLALALAAKALVPAGYMIGSGDKIITVEICADAQGPKLTHQIVIPGPVVLPGKADTAHKTEGACAWSGLGADSLAGADIALLAIALSFILALGFARVAPPRLERLPFLLPPLRGPPATI